MGLLDILLGREQPQGQNGLLNTARTGQASAFPPAPAPYHGVPLMQELAQNGGQQQGGFPPAPAPYNGVPLIQEMRQNGEQTAQPQNMQGEQQGGGFWGNLKRTVTSRDFGDRLTEGLIGLGRGSNIAEGLTSGAAAMYDGNINRRNKNQTVDWLINNGFSEKDAKAAASNSAIMQQIVSGQSKGLSPLDAVKLAQGEIGLKKAQIELDQLMNPKKDFKILSPEEKAQYGLPEDGVFQIGADGKIVAVSGGQQPQDPTTNDIKNYNFAKSNGYNGSFQDFLNQKGKPNIGGQTIDMDNLPMVTVDADGRADKGAQQRFLANLPSDLASQIVGISEGRLPIEKITSLRGGERQELARLTALYDPTFDISQAGARAATRKDYATGEMAKLAASSNLAIQHMAGMVDAHKKLNNSGIPIWNSVKNSFDRQTGGSAQQAFETYKLGVAEELSKAFHGTGAVPESAVREWKGAISASSSPEQLQEAVKSALHMLAARTETYSQRYSNVMGADAPKFLTDASVKALKDIGIDPSSLDPRYAGNDAQINVGVAQMGNVPTPPAQPALDNQPITQEQYQALPSGAEFIAPDGSRRRKP